MAIYRIRLSRRAQVFAYRGRTLHPTDAVLAIGFELELYDPVNAWHDGTWREAMTIAGGQLDGNCLLVAEIQQDLPQENEQLPCQQFTGER